MAQSIRDNIARLRTNVNSQFQTIDYPGTLITNNDHPATFTAPEPQPESVIRPIPSGVAPIVHIPLPVLRSEPAQRHPEKIVFPVVTEDNQITNEEVAEDAFEDDAEDHAKNAHYSFDSSVQDSINDHSHIRQETR